MPLKAFRQFIIIMMEFVIDPSWASPNLYCICEQNRNKSGHNNNNKNNKVVNCPMNYGKTIMMRHLRSDRSNESDYWIGLTADSLRHNRWNDNSPVTWINWQYPSVQPFGNWCGLLLTGGSSGNNTWRQSVCLYNKPFICKKGGHSAGDDVQW